MYIKKFESFNKQNIVDEIIQHVTKHNPHDGERDARWSVQKSILNEYEWSFEVIQPNDSRIVNLSPPSKRDVKRYMKLYQTGSEFPAIVLFLKGRGYDYINDKPIGEHFEIADGQHRLQAAVNLNVPIKAYVGSSI